MNAWEGKAWDRGTIRKGGVATVDEGGDPPCKLCRGRRWYQAVLCMVEYTAGAISKTEARPKVESCSLEMVEKAVLTIDSRTSQSIWA